MRKTISSPVLIGLLLLTMQELHAKAALSSRDEGGNVVIVFKDGHQQIIPASKIAAMELKAASGVTTPIVIPSMLVPGKRNFVGKWAVGEGNGSSFLITLDDNGVATKSIGAAHGTWTYVQGEARVAWDDGWHDAIRKVGSKYEKFGYGPGKSFTDPPANVTEARNTNPEPI